MKENINFRYICKILFKSLVKSDSYGVNFIVCTFQQKPDLAACQRNPNFCNKFRRVFDVITSTFDVLLALAKFFDHIHGEILVFTGTFYGSNKSNSNYFFHRHFIGCSLVFFLKTATDIFKLHKQFLKFTETFSRSSRAPFSHVHCYICVMFTST